MSTSLKGSDTRVASGYGAPQLEANESHESSEIDISGANTGYPAPLDESSLRGYESGSAGTKALNGEAQFDPSKKASRSSSPKTLAGYRAPLADVTHNSVTIAKYKNSQSGSGAIGVDSTHYNSVDKATKEEDSSIKGEPFVNSVVPATGYGVSSTKAMKSLARNDAQKPETLSGYEDHNNISIYSTSSDLSGYSTENPGETTEYCNNCIAEDSFELSTLESVADTAEELENYSTTEESLGEYSESVNSLGQSRTSDSQYNGLQFPFQLVASKGEKQCPGGSLEHCVAICPGTSARVYGACVQSCGNRCA